MDNNKSVANKKPSEKVDFIYIDQNQESFKYKDKIQDIVDELKLVKFIDGKSTTKTIDKITR